MSSNSDVQISISVIDTNGTRSVVELQNALAEVGTAGATAGAEAAAGMDKVGSHALTNLDNVRLLRDDLGIHIPRAMEKAIASSALLSSAIGAIGGGLIAFGAVEIISRMGEGLYSAYEKYLDLGSAAKAYQDQADKARDQDFVNPHSIETATARIREATMAAQAFHEKAIQISKDNLGDSFLAGLLGPLGGVLLGIDQYSAKLNEDASAKSQGQADMLQRGAQLSMQHELNLGEIELAHAGDGVLKGLEKQTAEYEKHLAINQENASYAQRQDNAFGNYNPALAGSWEQQSGLKVDVSSSGRATQMQQDAIAAAQLKASRISDAQEEHDEIVRLQQEALTDGLSGNALLAAQKASALENFVEKYGQSKAAQKAIDDAYAAKAVAQQDELDARVRKTAADAATAGLTGIAKIQAETAASLKAIDEEEYKAVGKGGIETAGQNAGYNSLRASASQVGNQKQMEAENQFYEQLKTMQSGYDASTSSGYAKIADDAAKASERILTEFGKTYGQMDSDDASYLTAYAATMTAVMGVEADAEQQRQRLHHQTMESLTKEEEQAAKDMLPPWLAAELAIVDQYQDRVNKAKQALNRQEIDGQEYNAEMVAASAVAQAQMVKQMQQTRDQLAGQLQSFFSNPEAFIEKRAMDTAFQFAANEMMQVFQNHGGNPATGALGWLFGMNGQASTSTNPQTFGASLLGIGGHGAGGMGMAGISQAGTSFQASSVTMTTAATTLGTGATTFATASQALLQGIGGMGVGGPGFGSGGYSSGGFGTGGSTFGGLGFGTGGSTSSAPDISLGGGGIDSAGLGDMPSAGNMLSGGGSGIAGTGNLASGLGSLNASSTGSPYMAAAGGAITGAMGVYSAYQNSNPLAGAMSGAMLGASVGSIIPGVGTAVGAVVGAVGGLLAGLFGDKGKGQAQDYDTKTVQPGIASELQQYNHGTTGYDQASQYLNQLELTAQNQTNSWGRGAASWYRGHILAEIQAAQLQLDTEEKAGRSQVSMSAAQYHTGGWIGDFGGFSTSSNEGFIHAKAGEFMVHDGAAAGNGALLSAINAGRTITPAAAQGSRMVPASQGAGSPLTIVAWDGASVDTWLRNGGAMKLRQAQNSATGQYGGVGIR